MPKVRCVVTDAQHADARLLLLRCDVDWVAEPPPALAAALEAHGADAQLTQHELVLDYNHFSADAVLRVRTRYI
jgi:hypothetical protein